MDPDKARLHISLQTDWSRSAVCQLSLWTCRSHHTVSAAFPEKAMFVVSRDVLESLIIDDQIEVIVLGDSWGPGPDRDYAPSVRIFRSELKAIRN